MIRLVSLFIGWTYNLTFDNEIMVLGRFRINNLIGKSYYRIEEVV